LFDEGSLANEMSSAQFALRTYQIYLTNAYVLPDAGVFLFLETYSDIWEIWSGFRASKLDTIRVFKYGTASSNWLTILELHNERRNFRGITLKSTTVVCRHQQYESKMKQNKISKDFFN